MPSSPAEPRPQCLSVPRESLTGLDLILADLGMDGEIAAPAPKPTRARQARERRRAKHEARGYRRQRRRGAKVEVNDAGEVVTRFGTGNIDTVLPAVVSVIQTGRLPRRRPCVVRLPRGRRGRGRAPRRSSSSSATSGADPPEDEGPGEPRPPGRSEVGWPYALFESLARHLPLRWRVRIYQALPERVQAFAARRLLVAVGRETIR
ncbi:MAG: hypothetical protein ACR2GG_08905 [Gemmatimonadaceae bacterium]